MSCLLEFIKLTTAWIQYVASLFFFSGFTVCSYRNMKTCDPVHRVEAHIFHIHTHKKKKRQKKKGSVTSWAVGRRRKHPAPCALCTERPLSTTTQSFPGDAKKCWTQLGRTQHGCYYNTCMCTSSTLLTWKSTERQVRPIRFHQLCLLQLHLLSLCRLQCVFVVGSCSINVCDYLPA